MRVRTSSPIRWLSGVVPRGGKLIERGLGFRRLRSGLIAGLRPADVCVACGAVSLRCADFRFEHVAIANAAVGTLAVHETVDDHVWPADMSEPLVELERRRAIRRAVAAGKVRSIAAAVCVDGCPSQHRSCRHRDSRHRPVAHAGGEILPGALVGGPGIIPRRNRQRCWRYTTSFVAIISQWCRAADDGGSSFGPEC